MKYPENTLRAFCRATFLALGCSEEDADLAANVLITADLRGIDSHGVARLEGYVALWDKNRINPKPNIELVHETPSTATLDGDAGLGLITGPAAMQKSIEKARTAGSGWVAVRNSNHFGIAGYHAMMALEHDMVGIAMTNASPLVAPTFSAERLLGTNPIAVAIPAGEMPPFVADFSTTTVANGKLEILQRKNETAPRGWLQDKDGKASQNPAELKAGGALLPLGSDRLHGSHKGYCLGAIVDIFSAVFSGANYGPWAPPFVSFLPLPQNPVGKGLGHFFGAIRTDAFRPAKAFKAEMDNWIRRFSAAKTTCEHPKVLIPGTPERILVEKRKKEGIPLLLPVVESLEKIGARFEIPFPPA